MDHQIIKVEKFCGSKLNQLGNEFIDKVNQDETRKNEKKIIKNNTNQTKTKRSENST